MKNKVIEFVKLLRRTGFEPLLLQLHSIPFSNGDYAIKKYAVTRIRNWVTSATTKGTIFFSNYLLALLCI